MNQIYNITKIISTVNCLLDHFNLSTFVTGYYFQSLPGDTAFLWRRNHVPHLKPRAMPTAAQMLTGFTMPDRSKSRGQMKAVSKLLRVCGWLMSPPLPPEKTCSPRNLIQGLGLEGIPGNELGHRNWTMILAHGMYDHCTIRGLYNPYHTKSIVKVQPKYKLELLAIQETRWLGQGIYDYKGYTIFYSGKSDGSHELGTTFIVSKKLRNNVIDFRTINERICMLCMKTKFNNMWIINAHGPTEDKAKEREDDFYQTLENTYNVLPQNDIKLTAGDLNAKIGKEEIYKGITGKYSLHAISNDNGDGLIDFARSKNIIISSTCFIHPDIQTDLAMPRQTH
jgi:hypothetical protein